MNAYTESLTEVVERELDIWRAECRWMVQERTIEDRHQQMRFREYMHEQFMSGAAPETLPMPRIRWIDVLLALVGW